MKVLFTALFLTVSILLNANPCLYRVESGLSSLQKWYNPQTCLWETTNWWNAANIATALIRYSVVTGSEEYLPVIDQVFGRNKD